MPQLYERGLMDTPPANVLAAPSGAQRERELARLRVEKKSKFRADVVAYVVINAFLIGIWAATGLGYFWPGWVLGGWGVLLLLDGWHAYFRRGITEAEIERELQARH